MATRKINFEDMRDAQKIPHSQSTQSQFYETNTQQDRRNQEQKIGAVVFSSGAFPPKNSKLATLCKEPASVREQLHYPTPKKSKELNLKRHKNNIYVPSTNAEKQIKQLQDPCL